MACGCIWVGVKRTSIVSDSGRTLSRSSLGNTLSFLDKDVCAMSYVRSATQSRSHFWESSQTTCWLVFLRNVGYITLLSCTSARMMKITLKLLLVLVQWLICAACWQLHANTKINVFDANCQPSVADVLDFRCLCVYVWKQCGPPHPFLRFSYSQKHMNRHIWEHKWLTGLPVLHILHFHLT